MALTTWTEMTRVGEILSEQGLEVTIRRAANDRAWVFARADDSDYDTFISDTWIAFETSPPSRLDTERLAAFLYGRLEERNWT